MRIHCQRQRCSPRSVVSVDIRLMPIFVGVHWWDGVKMRVRSSKMRVFSLSMWSSPLALHIEIYMASRGFPATARLCIKMWHDTCTRKNAKKLSWEIIICQNLHSFGHRSLKGDNPFPIIGKGKAPFWAPSLGMHLPSHFFRASMAAESTERFHRLPCIQRWKCVIFRDPWPTWHTHTCSFNEDLTDASLYNVSIN